ncbi:zinc protease [Fulvivirga imtechensis AK7]|uniref:Zinc protease n=1 Tax=Fulvivirga imtechensis AK7 TaxID=1237149 RepID=L8JTG8_9BACT|nr:pitrilysin family protein [Fulvivirga imtechensis]ELR72261.1 zinc protease [Fulvivirga imtechensis AK7]
MLDRTVAPKHSTSYTINFPKAAEHKLDNNIPVYTLAAGSQPIIKLEVLFPLGGSYYENKTAASFITLKMLQEGTKSYTSNEMSNLFAQYGAFVELHPSFDVPSVTLYCLTKYLNIVLPFFQEMILAPAFPENDLKRVQSIEAQQLKLQNEKSNIVASKKFRQLIFGSDNPYGKIINDSDIDQLTTKDLTKFHSANLSQFELLISGHVDSDTLKILNDHFGKEVMNTSTIESCEYSLNDEETFIKEDKKTALQSSIRMGKPVIDKGHLDYIKLLVANQALGGYFGSRLMKNIREDKGFTYGIHSSIVSLKHNCYFVIGTDVKKEFVDDVIGEINKEIALLCADPMSANELAAVKNHMFGHFQSQLNSAFSLAEKFKNIHIHGLDYTYYDDYMSILSNITSTEIQSIFNKYLQPEGMRKVVIG